MSSIPRLLVLGGSGELGQRLVQAAAQWQVHASYLHQHAGTANATWHRLDILDADAILHLVERVDPQVIIHAAFSDRSKLVDDSDTTFREKMVSGALNVAAAAAKHNARLIVMSTDLVYDGRKGHYSEIDIPNPIMAYGLAKVEMESALLPLAQGLSIVRTSLILSMEPMSRHIRWIVETARRGQQLNLFVDELRCPIWGDELAAALIELAQTDHHGLLHIAGPEVTNRYRLGQFLADRYQLDPRLLVPASSAASGLHRPLDCSLDSRRAYSLLSTKIHGVSHRFGQEANHE
jgi:dTDP-4-dehydrorhamnose reductase